ncbi:hypothetical protein [Reyranella sp.]|uniref:hypothetical protein n=1 Tax=Reyranella sp. TaxID=1929291 RepID=UPI003BAC4DCC
MTNYVAVADAIQAEAKTRTDLPDEIYFVATFAHLWSVFTLKRGAKYLPDEKHLDMRASELVDLTRR